MVFNFYNDLNSEINRNFKRWRIKPVSNKSPGDFLLDYLTTVKKLINNKKKTVRYSQELLTKLQGHPKEKEIKHLEHLFKIGGNLNPFQSKRLLQTRFHDHLVYEWNIYHFHLSLQKEPNRVFAKQVPQLLFVYINSSEAVFLDVDNHTDGVFGEVRWLEILHDNFPEVIEAYEDKRISEHFLIPDFKGKDRQTLWDKGYTIGMTRVRDKMYRSPGIGRMTSGHSILVVKTCNEIMDWIYQTSTFIEQNYLSVCSFLNIDISSKLKLRFGENNLEIFIELTNEVILTYPELFHKAPPL